MKYYKNIELAEIYHVSEKSVRNWIDAAEAGKLDLELLQYNGRYFIANTTKNLHVIEKLVQQRKKFKNSRGHKLVTPKPEFYKLFTEEQILDIMTNIDVHKEIPLQYSYFDGGARYWSDYSQKLLQEEQFNMLTGIIKLLDINQDYISSIVKDKKVNIVDLGVGDAAPVRNLISALLERDQVNRYMGVDFSHDMLAIAEQNVKKWFGDKLVYESHLRDLSYDRFEDLLRKDNFKPNGEGRQNLILCLGGTLTNFRWPDHAFQVINGSMGRNDYFIYGLKLDTESSRRYFDFYVEFDSEKLDTQLKLIIDLLNFDSSFYEVEQYFDEEQCARFTQIHLKTDVTITFVIGGINRTLTLRKGERILLWRYWHQKAMDVMNQFDRNGFDLLQTTLTDDKEYMLAIAKVKVGQINS